MAQSIPHVEREELSLAAVNLVEKALRFAPFQRLVVFADHESRGLAEVLHAAAKAAGGRAVLVFLEPLRGAPLKVLPEDIVEQLGSAQTSVFLASARPEEAPMRQHLLHLVSTLGLRHAHMPGITQLAFARGLRQDPRELATSGRRVLGKVQPARELRVTSPLGTDLRVALDPTMHWFTQLGVLELGRWGNLPAGALYVVPESVEGTFVASASLGEFFGVREGLLRDKPVRFEIQDGQVTAVCAPAAPALERDVAAVIGMSKSSGRVSLVAVGVNGGIEEATGDIVVDQNLPGLHLGIGEPPTRAAGTQWAAQAAFAACQSDATVMADGTVLIENGRVVEPV